MKRPGGQRRMEKEGKDEERKRAKMKRERGQR